MKSKDDIINVQMKLHKNFTALSQTLSSHSQTRVTFPDKLCKWFSSKMYNLYMYNFYGTLVYLYSAK